MPHRRTAYINEVYMHTHIQAHMSLYMKVRVRWRLQQEARCTCLKDLKVDKYEAKIITNAE